ncbi:MAG TPA: glycosyltransferase family 39 protein [Thermoanaerobaculia bacterium]|nr:glycosyltransferase family 39 protein [Thermoanaerobaculia bacterium]
MRRLPAIALAVVFVSVWLSPLQRELYVGDETKYSQVVREMRAGSFFLPTLNGTPFTHKPPLHFWAVDLLTHVFGVYSIWPFVLPSLISFALLLLLMRRMGGPMAAFVCGTSLLMWGSSQTARMDVAFAALLALSAHFIFRANGALPVSAGIASGLAFLVKGPMAPVITLALFAFESIRRRRKPVAKDALALLPMLLLPLLWLVPAIVIGGEAFWKEIFYKQTVGRAVGAWVHKSPPWFYLVRAPLTLAPWFFLCVAAIWKRRDERAKFARSYLLAVLVPYTLLSSKLDVYMIAMLPAVALLIASYVDAGDGVWGRRANLVMLSLFALVGAAGLVVQPHHIKEEDGALVSRLDIRLLFALFLITALAGIVVTLRSHLRASTIATGLVPVIALGYAGLFLVPLANELASTRPLVRALVKQNAPPEQVALYVSPHLWTRGMPPGLARARHVDAAALRAWSPAPELIVARRRNADEVADVLRNYRKVDELRMIGKWFDVYRK